MVSYLLLFNELFVIDDILMFFVEEIQVMIVCYKVWCEKFGVCILMGEKFVDVLGCVVGCQGDLVQVIDGFYVEIKEVFGGVFFLEVLSYEEVVEFCEDCLYFDFGMIYFCEVDVV